MTVAEHPLRQALWPLGLLYGGVTALRNGLYSAGLLRRFGVDVPVVSIGNLTVGGTGKTPTVAWLCRLARRCGRRPGVLARGYGRAPGAELNDEGLMLQRRLPELLQEQDPDRVAGARRLVAKGADYIVLDDGFQHRRLARDLDVVCIDALRPFGNGHCLPAGPLREWRTGLRRASVVLLTRASGLDPEQIEARRQRVRALARNPALPVQACEHAAGEVLVEPAGATHPAAELGGRRVVLMSAIARPQSFRDTVEALGAEVVGERIHRDHHRFTAAEAEAAVAAARAADATLLVTEKDDAKLAAFGLERSVLRIELRFLEREPEPAEFLL
ncbi:MAG: tetraacyldisaccharide 4'-kinase [Planctomycetes bacterium]|nr:tetraacyldisaccharide 4'-kinase [Planctomycetota bacterium]